MDSKLLADLKEIQHHLFTVIELGHGALAYTPNQSTADEIIDIMRKNGYICNLVDDNRVFVSSKNLSIATEGEGGNFRFFIKVDK